MKHSKEQVRLLAYARDSLTLLEQATALYRQGVQPAYRLAAVQLRILLCDTTRRHNQTVALSLIPRLLPELQLPPLQPAFTEGEACGEIWMENVPLINLDEWLDQQIGVQQGQGQFSLRGWIRTVCDQDGGAHVDPRAALMQLADVHASAERLVLLAENLALYLRERLELSYR